MDRMTKKEIVIIVVDIVLAFILSKHKHGSHFHSLLSLSLPRSLSHQLRRYMGARVCVCVRAHNSLFPWR